MDIALLLSDCEDCDTSKLSSYLKELGIEKAAESIFALCHAWFPSLASDPKKELTPQAFDAMEQYVLSAGTFGFSARTSGAARFRNEATTKSIFGAKAKIIFRMLFPSAEYLAKQYPWYSGSKILLPAVWIYRYFDVFLNRRKASSKALGEVLGGGQKEIEEARLLEELGWNIYSKK